MPPLANTGPVSSQMSPPRAGVECPRYGRDLSKIKTPADLSNSPRGFSWPSKFLIQLVTSTILRNDATSLDLDKTAKIPFPSSPPHTIKSPAPINFNTDLTDLDADSGIVVRSGGLAAMDKWFRDFAPEAKTSDAIDVRKMSMTEVHFPLGQARSKDER
ncbi:hypothetical protein BD779DRAFT_1678066 [Infundibulicybe gibba]|nr:hypothetical protein BD779DRAFT_1678066 [Infundibulicybe gibba]